VARKVYSNVYLFERNISPLQSQMNNRELEKIIQECIMMAIRESVPTESIIKAYMEESVEHEEQVFIEDVEDEVAEQDKVQKPVEDVIVDVDGVEEKKDEDVVPEVVPMIKDVDSEEVITKLSFNDVDSVLEKNDEVKEIEAPKTIERLEDISVTRNLQRKLEEEEDNDEDDKIKISTEQIDLSGFDVLDEKVSKISTDDILLNDFDELPPL
jgi:hypothetical protein